ncbi:uncharacterized protein LOC129950711 [Eupeodes corollae]|uniref:uncharacterized protein LOC129950711 n=1 Tax=Eupeodes corollae TaxID=290404 RepID=UPI002490F924|nr:uncharacterized protein LOC129950711 [Eupeodes corollae]
MHFESNVLKEVCGPFYLKKTRTTALHRQSESMVERFPNRTLKEHLCNVVDDNQRDWNRYIPMFLMAYRSARHSSTGHAPSEIMMGRNIRLSSVIKFGCPTLELKAEDDYIDDFRERLLQIHDNTRLKIKMFSDRMKTRYKIGATTTQFQAGDRVWLYNLYRQKSNQRCRVPDAKGSQRKT